jgi:hypothetical protein
MLPRNTLSDARCRNKALRWRYRLGGNKFTTDKAREGKRRAAEAVVLHDVDNGSGAILKKGTKLTPPRYIVVSTPAALAFSVWQDPGTSREVVWLRVPAEALRVERWADAPSAGQDSPGRRRAAVE